MEKILADTSAWVSSFSKSGHELLKQAMKEAVLQGRLMMTGMVLLELLQGVRNDAEAASLKKKLFILPFLSVNDSIWSETAHFSLQLRSKGVQAPVPDLFIARVAVQNDCTLLHCDRNYERIAKHSALKTMAFL